MRINEVHCDTCGRQLFVDEPRVPMLSVTMIPPAMIGGADNMSTATLDLCHECREHIFKYILNFYNNNKVANNGR